MTFPGPRSVLLASILVLGLAGPLQAADQKAPNAALEAKGAISAGMIFDAIEAGNVEAVRHILEQLPGAANARNASKRTPLIKAADQGLDSVVELLLQNKAEVNATGRRNETALLRAVGNGHISTVKLLLAAGADVNARDLGGSTALAQCTKDRELTALLIANKADVKIRNNSKSTSMHSVASNGSPEVADLLWAAGAGANLNTQNNIGTTPLLLAVMNGNKAMVQWLIAHDANLNLVDDDGYTPVNRAAFMDDKYEILVLLLEHGADPNGKDKNDRTPLDVAVRYSMYASADLLRTKGGTGLPSSGEIFQAAKQGDLTRVQRLIAAKIDVNAPDENGETPMHVATAAGKQDCVAALLAAGARPEVPASEEEAAKP